MALKDKVFKFLFKDYYLFWVTGFSVGMVLGSRYPFSYRAIVFEALFMGILLLAEFLTAYAIIYPDKNRALPVKAPLNKEKLFLLFIIPFIIFMVLGHGVLSAYGQNRNSGRFGLVLKDKNINSEDIIVEGRIASHPGSGNGYLYFYLEADKLYIRDKNQKLLSFPDLGEKINIRSSGGYKGQFARDEYIRIRGSLSMGGYRDSGPEQGNLVVNTDPSLMEKINADNWNGIYFSLRKRIYDCLKNTYYLNLDFTSASLSEAIILGNRNNIPQYLLNNFKKAGIYHLFAISGLHLSFFMSFIYFLFRRLRPSWLLFIVIVLFLAAYNFLVGNRASMIRASLGVLLVLAAGSWKREYSPKIILYFSYMVMLVLDPSFFYDPGFWLSFGAMAAIVFIYPALIEISGRTGNSLRQKRNLMARIALVSFSIQLFLFPVLVYYFGEVSIAAFALNAVVLPVFYIRLFILITSSGLAILWPPLGGLALKPGQIFFNIILKIINFTGGYDFYIIKLEDLTIGHIAAYYIILLALLALLAGAARRIRAVGKTGS